jgi:hypothetical protein
MTARHTAIWRAKRKTAGFDEWRSKIGQVNGRHQKEDRMSITEEGALSQRLESLEAQNLRLQALVCHLLQKNEELRSWNLGGKPQIADTFISIPEDHEIRHR